MTVLVLIPPFWGLVDGVLKHISTSPIPGTLVKRITKTVYLLTLDNILKHNKITFSILHPISKTQNY